MWFVQRVRGEERSAAELSQPANLVAALSAPSHPHPSPCLQALEKALLSFHTSKMADINKIVKELWQKTYRNQDIDYIQVSTRWLIAWSMHN